MKTKLIMTSLLSAIMGATCINSIADSSQLQRNNLEYYSQVDKGGVSVPIGYILLIRKDKYACAIRFTDYKIAGSGYGIGYTGNNSASELNTHFASHSYAEYDYFYQDDGSGSFKNENVNAGRAKLGNFSGAELLPDKDDMNLVKCGQLIFRWNGEVGVSFNIEPGVNDKDVVLAATKWRKVSEININDPRIKWYRFDNAPKYSKIIPVEDLW
jgi:hypothetical protein